MHEKMFGEEDVYLQTEKADTAQDASSALPSLDNSEENKEAQARPNALNSGFNPRPSFKANIKRHIFSVPKEDSQGSHIITANQENEKDESSESLLDNEINNANSNEDSSPENLESLDFNQAGEAEAADISSHEKTKRIFTGSAFVKRTSFSQNNDADEGVAQDAKETGQLVLDGFKNVAESDEAKTAQKRASEREIEAKLKESRHEIAKEFTLEQENIPYTRDIPLPPDTDIFQLSGKNRRAVYKHLSTIHKNLLLKTAALAVIGIVLLLLDLLRPTSNYMLFVFLNFILLIGAFAVAYSEIVGGFTALKNKKPNLDTGICFLWLTSILQNVVFFSQPGVIAAGLHLYNGASVLLALPAFVSKYLSVYSALRQVNIIASKETISVAAQIPDANSAHEMGRGVVDGEPLIQYNAKTNSLNNFIEKALNHDPSAKLCSILIPLAAAVSILVSIFVYFGERDVFSFATALSLTSCALIPASVTLSMVFSLFYKNLKLGRKRSGLINYESAQLLNKSNCVILSDNEVFPSSECNVHGILPFNKMPIDDAILITAAMLIKSEGPLSDLFHQVILERNDILPGLESLVYEDKLGLSAWIDDRKVLVGNLDHMRHHNVKLPEGDFYSKHCIYNRKPLFLAIEGVLAAMFVVSYNCDEAIARELKSITSNGVTLLIHVSDPNITEDFVEECLGLKTNTVKVMNQKTSEYYKLFRNKTMPSQEAENFHDGSALSFLRLINSSSDIESEKHVAVAAAVIASLVGLILISFFVFSREGLSKIANFQLVLYHAFWGLASLFIPKIVSLISKR